MMGLNELLNTSNKLTISFQISDFTSSREKNLSWLADFHRLMRSVSILQFPAQSVKAIESDLERGIYRYDRRLHSQSRAHSKVAEGYFQLTNRGEYTIFSSCT